MTHNLTFRSWGHNYNITQYRNEGLEIDLTGWCHGIKNGDFLLFEQGDGTTRYLVESIRYCSDPTDMWFAAASFAPREDSQ
jgi:hypothetical protein